MNKDKAEKLAASFRNARASFPLSKSEKQYRSQLRFFSRCIVVERNAVTLKKTVV